MAKWKKNTEGEILLKDRFIVPSQWHSVAPISYGQHVCPPGYSFGPSIRSHYLLHYILSGSGYLEKNGKKVPVYTGDIFVILPGEITTYGTGIEDPLVVLLAGLYRFR